MTTVDQFLKALAEVESSDDPEAWGLTEVASGYGILLYKVTPEVTR